MANFFVSKSILKIDLNYFSNNLTRLYADKNNGKLHYSSSTRLLFTIGLEPCAHLLFESLGSPAIFCTLSIDEHVSSTIPVFSEKKRIKQTKGINMDLKKL